MAILAVAAWLPPLPALADDLVIPAGSLGNAIDIIATRTGTSIGTTSPELLTLRIDRTRVSGSPPTILRRLLGPRAMLRPVPGGWMIVPAPWRRPAPPPPETRYAPGIHVIGRRDMALHTGTRATLRAIEGASLDPEQALRGAEALSAQVPMLSATHRGAGQDRLFLRGIADSSIAGTRTAVLGQYLDGIRIASRAPDPGLLPYDIDRIEFLPGPRSALAGAGALGGVIRTRTAVPDPEGVHARLWAGVTATAHGAPGADAGAMLNLPLISDTLALRAVAYHVRDGGYVDNIMRGRRDVDAESTDGGRIALRWRRDDWTLDLQGAAQDIRADDAHYTDPALPGLARATPFAEPASDRVRLAGATLRGKLGALDLRSVFGVVHQQVSQGVTLADSDGTPMPLRQEEDVWLVSSSTRLSRMGAGFGWLAGIDLISARDRQRHGLSGAAPLLRRHVRDREASIYGAVTYRPMARLTIEAEVREANLWLDGWAEGELPQVDFKPGAEPLRVRRFDARLLPALTVERSLAGGGALYARYARGFRPGGISAGARAYDFASDSIDTIETGIRDGGSGPLRISATLAHSRWRGAQSDLLDEVGLPHTINLGDATILSADAALRWSIGTRLRLDAAAIATHTHVDPDSAGMTRDAPLPDIPDFSARATAGYALPLASGTLRLRGGLRYTGISRAGAGKRLDLRQGGYATVDLSARMTLGGMGLSLAADNLLDARGTAFAYGKTVTILGAKQVFTQHPRTIRVGVDMNF